MITLADYKNPFDAIREFEYEIAKYTGAPYCVTTDCCTHAIEIAFKLSHVQAPVSFPAFTYLSVPMTMYKLGIQYTLEERRWKGSYQFTGTNIWDCARLFDQDMYHPNTVQCISFGMSKPLQIGLGGCLLTDSKDLYQRASYMRYDGRDIFNYSPWSKQKVFSVGYHYYLRPEECVIGLNLLHNREFTPQVDKYFDYPDCRDIKINA